jgi:hypothetical protein
MRRKGWLRRMLVVSLTAGVLGAGLAGADDKPDKDKPPAKKDTAGLDSLGKKLIDGLKATPGCLGVETGGTSSGKQVIFTFFENKKAVLAWFNSPTHQAVMDLIEPERDRKVRPMRHIPDDMPIMAIASISFAGKPAYPKSKIPFSQIAIELYTPLNGGLDVGGGFAPNAFRELRKQAPAKPAEK